MTNTDSNLKTVAQVDVQSAWASKINWTQAVGGVAMILTFMTGGKVGLDMSQQAAIVTVIGLLQGIVTWVVKTWFTKTITAASAAGPDVATKTVVKALLIAFALSAFLAVPSAMAQVKLKPLTGNLGNDLGITKPAPASAVGLIPTIDPQVLIQKVLALAAPDLVYAVALAKSANTTSSNVRLQCLTAIQNLNAQASGANLKDAAGNPLPSPAEPHIFTDLEQVAEGIDALSPTGPLFTSCAGAAALAGMNVLAFINAAVAGTAATAIVLPK